MPIANGNAVATRNVAATALAAGQQPTHNGTIVVQGLAVPQYDRFGDKTLPFGSKQARRHFAMRRRYFIPIWDAIDASKSEPPNNLLQVPAFKNIMNDISVVDLTDMFCVPAAVISCVKMFFFYDELDANHRDSPRLDMVAHLKGDEYIRYHPNAYLIGSWFEREPQSIIQRKVYTRKNIGRIYGR